jgi:hypothetical protein
VSRRNQQAVENELMHVYCVLLCRDSPRAEYTAFAQQSALVIAGGCQTRETRLLC